MHCIRLFAVAAVLALAPTSLSAADWPQFLGPNFNGVSSETGIRKDWRSNPPKMLWKVSMSDGGYAGPSVAGGKVYIIDHQDAKDIVKALDVNTGKVIWQYSYDDANESNYGFSRSTPTISNGKVYTLSRLGALNCLDAKAGNLIWSRNICKDFSGKKPQWDYAMSPLVDGNKLIVLPGGPDAAVAALDKNTGKTLWKGGGSDAAGYATPVKATINGKAQYVAYLANTLVGVDAATGTLLWSYDWKTMSGVNAASPLVIGNKIFISASYNHGCAFIEVNGNTAKSVYENKDMMMHFSSPFYLNGFIYGPSDPGDLTCLDAEAGHVKWKQEGFEKGPAVVVDGVMLIFNGKSGELVMVDPAPDSYKELGRFTPLGGQSWTAPIVSNGKLIVRNTKELACFNLK